MTTIAVTFAGEKITIRNKTVSEAIAIMKDSGVSEDWLYTLEAAPDGTIA